ncbi:3-phosphoinositide-dependent protein kinase 1-like isoform X1 [Branchiostoma floridae]|uniref:3-phosphoinositide-dependent protein kinase 1 n=1 Tax=Branchiostoma floridae TaxID=7739 RepID=A0A9J7M6H1_BRAFL|nr:3-phosphoinositide-dependent protein kinase 1-like isoform X1 [Branchiostoma floridae]
MQFCCWGYFIPSPPMRKKGIPSNPDPLSSSSSTPSHQPAPSSGQPEELQGATASTTPGNMALPSPAAASPSTPTPPQPRKKTPNDFEFGRILGEGSYSTVVLARDVNTGKEYAIKILEKRHIIREKKVPYVTREKDVLSRLNHPFFVKLYFTFQDVEKLYFGLSYAKNGELLPYIQKLGSFDEECTRFYTAEIILALEHLHGLGIIHRDLKPENILLDEHMHIQITDFGTAKILDPGNNQVRANSFVGTAQYVSPELLTNKAACKSSDLWALGCIIYQMVSGLPPFRAGNEYLIFQKIQKLEYDFPDGFNSKAQDLVKKLLILEPTERLGCEERGGYPSLRGHLFVEGIEWDTLPHRTPPRLLPYLPANSPDAQDLRSDFVSAKEFDKRLDDMSIFCDLHGLEISSELKQKEAAAMEKVQVQERKSSADNTPKAVKPKYRILPHSNRLELNIDNEERQRIVQKQRRENKWHHFVEGNIILKMGLTDKRKGLFARRRQLLLTEGPHLYYVDPVNMVLKGEIPWSPELRPEAKNFKTYFVHTPNRTYYLEDPDGYALQWCKKIDEVRRAAYPEINRDEEKR